MPASRGGTTCRNYVGKTWRNSGDALYAFQTKASVFSQVQINLDLGTNTPEASRGKVSALPSLLGAGNDVNPVVWTERHGFVQCCAVANMVGMHM
jgi:hypothetical protein